MADVETEGWDTWTRNTMTHFANRLTACTIGRFVLTFITLHSLHWVAMAIYTAYCIDITIYGFITGFITGHGPVCHCLLSIAYFTQNTMYSMLATVGISAGITLVCDLVLKKAYANE